MTASDSSPAAARGSGWRAVAATTTALADLLLPATCVGCARQGHEVAAGGWRTGAFLCARCGQGLRVPARPSPPRPCPDGLPVPWAVTAYDGVARAAIIALKEHGCRALARPLGGALADAAGAAGGAGQPLALVPVPTTRAARRARGDDPMLQLARAAARLLRRSGRRADAVQALRHVRSVRDQAGLDAQQRRVNRTGSMTIRRGAHRMLAGHLVVVVDDVVTTGATLLEAVRALRAAGVPVGATAVVAATQRRAPALSQRVTSD